MSTDVLLLGGGVTPPTPTRLRGQFMMHTRNPFYDQPVYRDRGALPDRYFMAELDVLWWEQPDEARRILDQYQAWGGNHIMTGGPWGPSYANHFPRTDWLSKPDGLVRYLRELASRGIAVSYVVAPDVAPYYDERANVFDWGLMERDYDPFYRAVTQQVAFPRVVTQWEKFGFRADMAVLFDWVREHFPNSRRAWHNPPGHLSPGDGSEEERGTWESAIAHGITDFYFQAIAPDERRQPGDLSPYDQMRYDLWDMERRVSGVNSPWGGPLPLTCLGEPLAITYTEGVAHAQYWEDYPDSIGATWGAGALSVAGVQQHSFDGITP